METAKLPISELWSKSSESMWCHFWRLLYNTVSVFFSDEEL